MKDKLVTFLTLTAFFGVLVLGSVVFAGILMILLSVVPLKCMFSTNNQRNESI